ncbi:MAG: ACT domain-containing protein [Clostridia bacterium]|nr:ACT domain-containing protein [Clostridia bacterium]
MKLELLPMAFTVCQLPAQAQPGCHSPFTFLSRTDEEVSLVCPSADAPDDALQSEPGWRCLRVAGPLDFSLVGILARIAACLAARSIPIFALSTFNTDYILLKEEYLLAAQDALTQAGYDWIAS